MYFKGFDDTEDTLGLSANSAVLLPTDGDVGYAEPASSAFEPSRVSLRKLADAESGD